MNEQDCRAVENMCLTGMDLDGLYVREVEIHLLARLVSRQKRERIDLERAYRADRRERGRRRLYGDGDLRGRQIHG